MTFNKEEIKGEIKGMDVYLRNSRDSIHTLTNCQQLKLHRQTNIKTTLSTQVPV